MTHMRNSNGSRVGEEANTKIMKLVKTDREMSEEIRTVVEGLVELMAAARTRGIVINVGLDNGAQGTPVALTFFQAQKVLDEYRKPQPQGQDNTPSQFRG